MHLGDTDCWVCGKHFDTVEEHDEHYLKCANENVKTEYSAEEVFDKMYYEDA
ncbi:hypothetical protein [Bacillus phage BvP]